MRAKAIRTYTDKYTMESMEKGIVVDMTQERFEEINSTQLGVFVEPVEPEIEEEEPKKEMAKKTKKSG